MARDRQFRRLAHGLKTPLAILAQEADVPRRGPRTVAADRPAGRPRATTGRLSPRARPRGGLWSRTPERGRAWRTRRTVWRGRCFRLTPTATSRSKCRSATSWRFTLARGSRRDPGKPHRQRLRWARATVVVRIASGGASSATIVVDDDGDSILPHLRERFSDEAFERTKPRRGQV